MPALADSSAMMFAYMTRVDWLMCGQTSRIAAMTRKVPRMTHS